MNVVPLPREAGRTGDVRNQDDCKALRKMGTREAANPLEAYVPGFGKIPQSLLGLKTRGVLSDKFLIF
ncbi:hypothetical protein GRI69_13695 [Erythrobacter vulgaris]|uniref:Uncharacterized protein n=1 Tax=Qipengyuania vulgaris TaxID=291985 RepID=A0A844XVS6_9SPHN|nr:hypothetical protein [Qipengyuania vulgaris]MXO49307.1 hypothetical protein [Qipengyuania vulgaris]